jgi:inner membrane protein
MMGPTHFVIGGATWLGAMAVLTRANPSNVTPVIILGGYVIASISALEPDIDTKNSLASKMLGPITQVISYVVRKAFGGHRKITHSLIGMGLVGLGVFGVSQWLHIPPWIGAAIMTGWISHVLADMTTREGCPLLWPISKKKYGLHFVETGKRLERYVIHPLALIASVIFGTLIILGK